MSKEYPLTGFATLVNGVSVSKIDWMDAIYGNLQESGLIRHESRVENLAKLLNWDLESEKYADLAAENLKGEEIIEIITKLAKIDAKHFKNCLK